MIIVFTKIGFYIQMQLLDFLGIITFRRTNWKSSLICSTKKRGKLKRKNGLLEKILSEIARGVQKTLDMFIETLRKVKARASKYVPRFKTPKASPYTGDKLTEIEKISYQRSAYQGVIRHLFLFYPFDEKLDAWERENYPQNDYRVPLCKIARGLVIMCKKRIALYTNLITDLDEKPALAELCGFQSIPTAKIFSRVIDENRMGIEPFRELFYDLSKTSRSLELWKGRLIGLDGSLIKIADRRSESERSFSRDKWGYRRDKMSNRGAREAELYMLITEITTHLTAITAYYVGRTDLVRSPTAFSRIFPE
jgi:hypothetical protein